jgi:hypothetical protein
MRPDDLRVARVLGRHFNDMHGLRHVVAGVGVAIPAAAYLLRPDQPVILALSVVVVFIGMTIGKTYLGRYYAREFGRIPGSERRSMMIGAAMGVSFVVDSHVPGLPSVTCALLAAWRSWIVFDCWPLRKYQLLTVAAAVYVSIMHVRVPETPTFVWIAQGVLIFGWALVPTGIADHVLLTRLMRRRAARDAIAARNVTE